MEDIAAKCGVSKSMLYHYFDRKEDVLYEILQTHLKTLIEALQDFTFDASNGSRLDSFYEFVEIYLEQSNISRAKHVVALHDMRYLTETQQKEQKRLERKLIDVVVGILEKITPGLSVKDYRLFTLLLIGMMNWAELWYRRSGPLSPPEFYAKLSNLFLNGFSNIGAEN